MRFKPEYEVTEKAPAKVNLFLDVLSKRSDGYHNIKSIMQSISLYDEVHMTYADDDYYSFECEGQVPGDANLILKTLGTFYNVCRPRPSYEIRLEKEIPMCAGMGGGSTDAAAALRLLTKVYGKPMRDGDMECLLDSLGCDVPFCMTGGTAICEGRGEIITPINSPPLYYLLLNAGDFSRSHIAYKELDIKYLDFKPPRESDGEEHYKKLLSYLLGYSSTFPELYNIFEDVVLKEGSNSMAHRILREYSASGVLMTGSGPYVYGVYENKDLRDRASDELMAQNIYADIADSVLRPVKDNSAKLLETIR